MNKDKKKEKEKKTKTKIGHKQRLSSVELRHRLRDRMADQNYLGH